MDVSENGRTPPARARGHAGPRKPRAGKECGTAPSPSPGFINCLLPGPAPGPGKGSDGTRFGASCRAFGGGPVTAPLARRTQHVVLRMFFEGLSFDQIARHAGVGKGSVEEIIRRLKSGEYEEFQDIHDRVETLRDTAARIRKKFSGDHERAHAGSGPWAALDGRGVVPA